MGSNSGLSTARFGALGVNQIVHHACVSFIQGNEFIVIDTIGCLSCYSHESCGHVERLEWLAWFVLGCLNSFLQSAIVFSVWFRLSSMLSSLYL